MTATVTVDNTARNYYSSFNASLVAGFSALGITGSDVVYNSGSFVIFKVSNGTGTYADNYLKFEKNGITTYNHSLTVGTGHTAASSTISGAGTESAAFYTNSVSCTHRTIKADDGSCGIVQIIYSGNVVGSYGFVKPTTTTESANDISLVVGLSSINSNGFQNSTGTASISWRSTNARYYGYATKYQDALGTLQNVQPYGNLRNVVSAARKGNVDHDAFAQSVASSGGTSSSASYSYMGNVPYSAAFGLDSNVDGNLPVMPNAVVKSGGIPIGYNSNLAYCKLGLNPGDNIIVTADSEEYMVISSDGLAIRTV